MKQALIVLVIIFRKLKGLNSMNFFLLQIHDIQQEMQELRLAFDAKDNLARKLEYEMKLKSG